jgi:hypothetical protein
MLLAAMGTACGGGAGTPSTVEHSTGRPGPSTTTARVRLLSQPNVIDRGDDFAAIAGSLVLFVRWLEWHNPDPALVERAYQPGSPPERVASERVTELRRTGAHIVEADCAPFDLAIISVKPNVVSLRLTEHLSHRELVDSNGRVLARDGARTEHYVVSIARWNAEAPWRVNLVERRSPRIEVQL